MTTPLSSSLALIRLTNAVAHHLGIKGQTTHLKGYAHSEAVRKELRDAYSEAAAAITRSIGGDTDLDGKRYRALRAAIVAEDQNFLDKLEAAGDALGFDKPGTATEEQVDAAFDRAMS